MALTPEHPTGAAVPSALNILEVNAQNFMREVVQVSLQIPVLVYFTAAWCGPCKQFGPLLEKVVNEAGGRARLAKVDIDKNPQLAQQFRIQSVPMVYIFVGGQPADGFSGALPESQIRQLLSQFMQATPEEEDAKAMLANANTLLESGDAEQAARLYHTVLGVEKENVEAFAGLARAHIALGQLPEAEKLLAAIPAASANHKAVITANAQLALAKSAPAAGAIKELKDKLAKNADDYQARYDLASALFAAGQVEEAIDELLHIIASSKEWNDNAARKKLLTIFEALGFEHPLSAQGRRKLSAILFR